MDLVLQNQRLRLAVNPARGGKITSLRRTQGSREWLWRNPHLAEVDPRYGMSYVESLDNGGWDEIFPSVSPCEVSGSSIPDHGDLVSLPWEVTDHSPERLDMEVTTRFAPCRFRRTLTLEGETLRISYRVTNDGATALPWLWCAHPLLALEPGMTLALPAGTPMRTGAGHPIAWPRLEGAPPLDHITTNPPFAAKLFTEAGSTGEFSITSADRQETLRLRWDPAELPFLGLWMNRGAWSGCGSAPYFNLGVEPATAPCDSLADAIRDGHARWLQPSASCAWSLELTLSHLPDSVPASTT